MGCCGFPDDKEVKPISGFRCAVHGFSYSIGCDECSKLVDMWKEYIKSHKGGEPTV